MAKQKNPIGPVTVPSETLDNGMQNRTLLAKLAKAEKERDALKRAHDPSFVDPTSLEQTYVHKDGEYQFDPGIRKLNLPGRGIVDAETLLAIAAGKELNKSELLAHPEFENIAKADASAILDDLIKIGYANLNKIVKSKKD